MTGQEQPEKRKRTAKRKTEEEEREEEEEEEEEEGEGEEEEEEEGRGSRRSRAWLHRARRCGGCRQAAPHLCPQSVGVRHVGRRHHHEHGGELRQRHPIVDRHLRRQGLPCHPSAAVRRLKDAAKIRHGERQPSQLVLRQRRRCLRFGRHLARHGRARRHGSNGV